MSATAITGLREDITQFWVAFKESERLRGLERQETERLRELDRQKTERLFQELAQAQQKTELAQQKTELAHQKTEKTIDRLTNSIQKTEQAIDRLTDNINNGLGGLRNSIGHIIEMILLPGLSAKVNALGHLFTKTSYGNVFRKIDGSALAGVDLYLENGDEVMVVEAKTLFNEKDVTNLLARVQKLRKNEVLTGVNGKTIYAAAAGVNFTTEARRMIKENGIYLVEVNEENDKIKVSTLSIDEAGKW